MIEWIWSAPGQPFTQAAALRKEVFCDEQGYAPSLEFDDLDAKAWHLVLLYDGQPAGCGRILQENNDTYLLGRIAIRQSLRDQHLGRALVEEMIRKAEELGAQRLTVSAQCRVQGFYEKLGFRAYGHPYPDGHIPHITMHRICG